MRSLLVITLLAGCAGDLVEPWQLAHDRIIAVRATPPRLATGISTLDLLVAHADAPPAVLAPDATRVISPAALASAVTGDTVTAPSDLTAARTELGLDTAAPVPLVVEVSAAGFTAMKTVWLGDVADNPQLLDLQMAGAPPPEELVFPVDTNIPLHVTADDTTHDVTWLTSCGTMHDFDLSRAYLRIEPDDPQAGELVVVLRDPQGGVAWQMWPVRAE